jgi:hypothetical protein
MKPEEHVPADDTDADRREFLATCGKFAVVTPPAVTMLLSTSLHSPAIAQSSGARGHSDEHEQHHDRWDDRRGPGWWSRWW